MESTRGPYGGYRVGRGIRLPPLVFTATEAFGLVMAVLDGSHAAADADDPVGAALGKIIRVRYCAGDADRAGRRHLGLLGSRPGSATISGTARRFRLRDSTFAP